MITVFHYETENANEVSMTFEPEDAQVLLQIGNFLRNLAYAECDAERYFGAEKLLKAGNDCYECEEAMTSIDEKKGA